MKSKTMKLHVGMEHIYFCFKLNIAVLIGTVVGGVIFGIGPSLLAANHLVRKNQLKEEPKFAGSFAKAYRDYFKAGNILLLPVIVMIMATVFLFTKQIIVSTTFLLVINIISLVVLSLFFLTILSMYEYYDLSIKEYYIKSLAFIGYNPVVLLVPLGWLIICILMTKYLPGLLPFLSIGIWLYINMAIFVKIFDDNEKKIKVSNKVSNTN